jgi:Xaa-Pro aminopeptidase
MFFLDTMPASYRDVLSVVRDAQHEAFKMIRPGVLGKGVDAAVRNYLKKYDLAERFTHSLGHGVGMEVHEAPRLSITSDAVLQENMVCTVEPGVYFPGKYGIRLEEMVLVTKKGCEVLANGGLK